jgi:hypothetical protein
LAPLLPGHEPSTFFLDCNLRSYNSLFETNNSVLDSFVCGFRDVVKRRTTFRSSDLSKISFWSQVINMPSLVQISLSLLYRHGGDWGERRYSSYSFTTSALDGGEWSASRPGRAFTPGERTTGTHRTGGWVGLRSGLDTEDRGKILCPRRGSNPDRPVVQPVVRH